MSLSCITALQALDLEGDWDPEAYDRQMANLYGDEDFDVSEKPHWDEDIDIGDIETAPASTSSKKKKKKKKKGNDHGDGETLGGVDVDAMDADVEKTGDDEEWDGTEEMRKRKLDECMNEIYGLEFNDMVRTLQVFASETLLTTTLSSRLATCQRGLNMSLFNHRTTI